MLGELSERYVILQARDFRRINMKLGSRAKIRAIESSMPDEGTGPFAMDVT